MEKPKMTNAIEEYKYFLQEYLFPLLGMPKQNNIQKCNIEKGNKPLVFFEHETLYFCNNKKVVFKVTYIKGISEDNIKLSRNIIQMFFKISKFKMDYESNVKNNNYFSEVFQTSMYKAAVQKGICNWIVGANDENVEELFEVLEKWSVQTYEGKKVTLGFIINPNVESEFDDTYGTWSDFLRDDLSAVFTDCINTVIELDKNCNFYKYLSLTEHNYIEGYSLTHESAFRFSGILQKYVTGNKVGIFLLNNGDIILSKNRAIKFVKRNLKWLNFSYDAFKNAFGDFFQANKVDDNVLMAIFSSMLDVSFSHTGGIISLVCDVNKLLGKNEEVILNVCDYLLNEKSDQQIKTELKEKGIKKEEELKQRILKRKLLKSFIGGCNFVDLDRKLRSELISLDGACIIDTKGNICACGAIIQNESGSTGGGRGAASKKLSEYGFSIKISTDGYIELYIDRDLRYSIK